MVELVLYLIRHEDAEDSDPDEDRALTPEGRRRMARTARFLAERGEHLDLIRTSPLVRAVQTAEILANGLGVDDVEIERSIASPPAITRLFDRLTRVPPGTKRLAIVGHEPTLSGVVLHMFPDAHWTGMKRGAVLCATIEGGAARFEFFIDPKGPTLLDTLATSGHR
ncbi:MAG: phosphohistidine phosphatase SixA [Deltaproteobacteria bacterium]|nr:phosphohistidine phosphatase SixA [Deltaproteobacteria bacterium]